MKKTPVPSAVQDPAATLVVPMSVAALCVGQGDAGKTCFIPPRVDFSGLPYVNAQGQTVADGAPISEVVLQPPLQSTTSLDAGVHLHWALPDALTHGYHDAQGGEVVFPDAPNRWLVTRLWQGAQGLTARSWVVESNYLSATDPGGSITVPQLYQTMDDTGPTWRFLGRRLDWDTWSEQEPAGGAPAYLPHLTVLGYGDPTFACLYPSCRSVFGLHDDLQDLGTLAAPVRLAYVVSGWYSPAQTDPLQAGWVQSLLRLSGKVPSGDAQADIATALEIYAWQLADVAAAAAPTQTLCSGMVLGVTWDPARTKSYLDTSVAQDVGIAIGNTATEALSALLARQLADPKLGDVELFMNAFQYGLLPALATADGLLQLKEAIHQGTFEKHDGGSLWEVRAQPNGTPGAPPAAEVTLPDALADALNALNLQQAGLDRAQDELRDLRWQVFVDWYKLMVVAHQQVSIFSPPNDYPDAETIRQYLQLLVGNPAAPATPCEIGRRVADVQSRQAAVTAAAQAITAQLQQQKLPYQLSEVPAPRYWRPGDPVVLLQGDLVQPAQRYGQDGRFTTAGVLVCRTGVNVVQAVKSGGSSVAGSPAALANAGALPGLYPTLSALCQEAGLFAILAASQPDVDALLAQVAAGITAPAAVPSPLAVSLWSCPWLPIVMQWEVQYVAAGAGAAGGEGVTIDYTPEYVSGRYTFDPDRNDFTYTGPALSETQVSLYSGQTVITPGTANLRGRLQSYLQYVDDAELAGMLQGMLSLPLLAQSLGGFGDALMMRHQTLQLQVADPTAPTQDLFDFSQKTVRAAVADQNTAAPLLGSVFCPIRGGFAALSRLRIVDAFGRYRDVDVSQPIISQPLQAPANTSSLPARYFTLNPRLVAPTRLQLRWLAADNDAMEMSSHPATTPVVGWAVPSFLDGTLLIYDGSGAAIGAITPTVAGNALTFAAAPGSPDPSAGIDVLFQDKNPHLKAFVVGVCQNPPTFLAAFLETADLALGRIDPQDLAANQTVAVLLGRPLAIARASLRLDVQGLFPTDQGWDAFAQVIKSQTIPAATDHGATQVRFGVQLGDPAKVGDGLVGYFVEGTTSPFATLYTPVADAGGSGIVPVGSELQLTAAADASPLLLTLLLDPRAKVHAKTGILPTKAIDIPPDQYAAALAALQIAFDTSVIVTPADALQVPIPKESAGQWAWLQYDGQVWSTVGQLTDASDRAVFGASGPLLRGGWLQLSHAFDRLDKARS